jgi:hypothetical protein
MSIKCLEVMHALTNEMTSDDGRCDANAPDG